MDHPERWGNFAWHRARGASKQVAFELARQEWQRTREYIADLRENGWTVWGVVCNFCGEHAFLWGFEATNPPMNPALNPLVAKSPARSRTGWNKRDTQL